MLLPALGRESCPWKLQTHVVSSPSGAGRMLTCSPSDCPSWRNTGGVWMGKVSSHTFPHCLGKILQGSSEMLCHHQTSGHPKNRPQLCVKQLYRWFPASLLPTKLLLPWGAWKSPDGVLRLWGDNEQESYLHTYIHIYTPQESYLEREKQKLWLGKAARCRSCGERFCAQPSPAAGELLPWGILLRESWHWDVFNLPSPEQSAGLQTAGHLVSSQLTTSWRTARKKPRHWTAASWFQCF